MSPVHLMINAHARYPLATQKVIYLRTQLLSISPGSFKPFNKTQAQVTAISFTATVCCCVQKPIARLTLHQYQSDF